MNWDGTKPILCYVTDRRSVSGAAGAIEHTIERAVAAGVDWIQVREKDLEARPLAALVRHALEVSRGRGCTLVNGRMDVALATGAAGVHLGATSLPVARVAAWRAAVGRPEFVIGVSCHSREAVLTAEHAGADYVFFGPVFATPSKAAFGSPQGLERLAAACRGVSIPVLAIGGITESNAADCLAAGASGIAAIGMFQQTGDIAGIASRLHELRLAK